MNFSIKNIHVLAFLTSLLICVNCFGQFEMDSTDQQITEIKQACDKINADTAKLKVEEKDIMDQSTEGGFVRMYFDEKTLKKAIVTFYGEGGQSTAEYYLLNGEIIFCFEVDLRYKNPIYMGDFEIKSREENLIYLKNKKIIRWYGNEHKLVSSALYPKKEKDILQTLHSFY